MAVGGALVVRSLLANGTQFLFGVPGESNLPVLEALGEAAGRMRFVACRRAASAAFMADAAGKLTGRAGVCMLSQASGALDAAIGVHAALQAFTPMVVLICAGGRPPRRGEAFHEVDYLALYRPLTKWVADVDDPDLLAEYLSRAFHAAHSGRPGPVALVLPPDILSADVAASMPKAAKPAIVGASDAAVIAALALLGRSARPLVVAGGAGWTPQAARDLARFAETNRIPVATAPGHPDAYDNRLETYVGRLCVEADPGSARCIESADLLMVVGSRLGRATTSAYSLEEPPYAEQRLIHVSPDPDELGRIYAPDLAIAASPGSFLSAIAGKPAQARAGWQEWMATALAAYKPVISARDDAAGLLLAEIVRRLDSRLPEDAVICAGAGRTAICLHRHFHYKQPRTSLAPINDAGGYGIPAAVAAKLIAPGRTVVALVGNRSCEMSIQELGTATYFGANIIVIVVDNGMRSGVRLQQERLFPGRSFATDLVNPNFAQFARCYGALGFIAADTHAFDGALEQALSAERPALIALATEAAQESDFSDDASSGRQQPWGS
jgi:acetolactate synthase-1/2/3 large subunit